MSGLLLAIMTPDGWRPGIGDPTVMGWLTVAGYLAASWLSGQRCRRIAKPAAALGRIRVVLMWSGLALLLFLLGINKQLDLQSWFTSLGRAFAREHGWYERRGQLQAAFVLVLAFALIVSLILIATRLGQVTRRCRLALLGAAFLWCFIVIRAVSFHHVDQLLGLEYSGLRVNWILELGGIGCIALAAGWRSMNRGVPVTAA